MVKKVIKYPIIREVELNNKARKGKYIYVKLERGKSPSYYKKKSNYTKKDYLETKKHGIIAKKKGVTRSKSIEKYIKRIKTGKKLESNLASGIAQINIKNAQNINPYKTRLAYMNLLLNRENSFKSPIVKDRQLAELLSRPDNVSKYKHRLEYQVDIIGEKGEKLATVISAHKGKLLNEVIQDVKEKVKIGMEIEGEYNLKGLEGYQVSREQNGKVRSFNVRMVFRKG